MKRLAILIGSTSLLGTGAAWAAITCTSSPSCSDLGYTSSVSSCSGDYLVCPFDTSKVYCIQCPEQCTELGYTQIASNGTYTCSEGQTVVKCPQNNQKYRCDGTACSYGYYTYAHLPTCDYEVCCDKRATYGNTDCYKRIDNTKYKYDTEDYVRCLAAAYSVGESLPYVGVKGGSYKDACGYSQYEVKYYCMKEFGYSGSSSSCSGDSCTFKSWYSGNDDSGYQNDCTDTPCYEEWVNEVYGNSYYKYNGMTFSEYCYKKYNLRTYCDNMKFMGETISGFDYWR